MAEFGEGDSHWACVLACHVGVSSFGLGGRQHDVLDGVAHDVHRYVGHGDCHRFLGGFATANGSCMRMRSMWWLDWSGMVQFWECVLNVVFR